MNIPKEAMRMLGDEMEFIKSMSEEIEEIGDLDLTQEFQDLQQEAIDLFGYPKVAL